MALHVEGLTLAPFGTNTYVVRASAAASEAVVVDPSGSVEDVLSALERHRAVCAAILVTHGHVDHIISLADLHDRTGAPVYAPEGERMFLLDPGAHSVPGLDPPPCEADVWLTGGETIEAAGMAFAVTSVPGHSPAHLAYAVDGHLFSGDVLFAGSVGRTDFAGGDWTVLLASIASLVDAYPPDTVVHPGHGGPTTLGAELAANPFLEELRAGGEPA